MTDGLEYWFAAALIVILLWALSQQIEIGRMRRDIDGLTAVTPEDLDGVRKLAEGTATKLETVARRVRELKTPRKR